ncbi:GDSL-type esterase/lipase family protein [Streptomyces drozdowiczii]|uniref:GDSL-type esterase/lipase family protein n=1 Tax=Streptomyces drozdowiczii TaxID=202862 RepID=A0ABY6PMF3_9ACTN|nr:GDSL-type esterase/lipase family protein [Streptomyces drozdowiczii]MCX0247199.1 GDSL-type esterase/lipase family protein [Streptomyces drozdowiczii]UZK53377.1 GDSL-type esterase/lipase family protein [Streptomyces drozdowiczii]
MSTETPAPLPYTTPVTPGLLRGALDVERTEVGLLPHRLPPAARAQAPDGQIALAEAQPSGVRLAFRTRATVVELEARRTRTVYQGVPPRPGGVYDLLVDGVLAARSSATGGNVLDVDMTTGSTRFRDGPVGSVRFDGLPDREKDVEVWLPYNERTEVVALHTDAPVTPAPASGRKVWLHHGSSISHGSDAASPTATWPARAALLGGVELVNLGLGGSALLDPFTARAMRDTPADLISVKIGINLVNADVMRLRAFAPAVHGFLDTIREGHPGAPLLVVSPVLCPIHEDTPGPSVPDLSRLGEGRVRFAAMGDPGDRDTGKLTLRVIRDELARLVEQRSGDDPQLHYLDGRELYGEADAEELPLPDALHPDAATHLRMGDRFAALAFGADGAFAGQGA